ncbi:hypothetical protein SDC9_94648 [bioreactor metagenome]|uniref:Uncharacterized protein n=1 Tax=bioreactor metagenome TaxID=1076179 RepID=A0A645A4D2_9ZZZZ
MRNGSHKVGFSKIQLFQRGYVFQKNNIANMVHSRFARVCDIHRSNFFLKITFLVVGVYFKYCRR